jgi:hypothetical protein
MVEGFDTYAAVGSGDANFVVQIRRNWDSSNYNRGDLGGVTTAGRGSQALYNYGDNSYYTNLLRDLGTVYPTIIAGMSWQGNNTTGTTSFCVLLLRDSAGTEMGRLYWTGSAGQFAWRNGSGTNVLTTSVPGGIALSTWYTLEIMLTAGTTTGYVEIHVNGVSYSANNVNTVGAALTTGARSIMLGPPGSSQNFNTQYIDHFYLMDNTTTSFNTFQGDLRIRTLIPSGAGGHSDWTPTGATPNWNCVKEAGLDQDTTYNATSTAGARDSYALTQIPSGLTVYAASISAHAKTDDATPRQTQFFVRSGVDQSVGSATSLASDYTTRLVAILPTNPLTAGAWTAAAVNALEAGIRLIS